jgi:hypothetical protein
MAISEDKNRLFTTVKDGNEIGIALWEIYSCLRYYKRDKRGNRDLGMVIENGVINKWARHKPLVYSMPVIPDTLKTKHRQGTDEDGNIGGLVSDKVQCKAGDLYGMTTVPTFQTLQYRRPKDDTWKRLRDFDGYIHTCLWENTNDRPFVVGSVQGSMLGGYASVVLTLGKTSDESLLSGQEVIESMGLYAGLLFVRPNANSSLNSNSVFNDNEYILITTEKPLRDYVLGNTMDSTGLCKVSNQEGMYVLDFKMTKGEFLTNSDGGFDGFVGKTMTVYPILANKPICFLDNLDTTTLVTRLALSADLWSGYPITLTQPSGNVFVEPTLSISYETRKTGGSSEEIMGVVSLLNIVGTVRGNQPYNATYNVNVTRLVYNCYWWNGSSWVVQNSNAAIEWGESVLVSYNGETRTLSSPPDVGIALTHAGLHKIEVRLEATCEYNGKTNTILGVPTVKEFSI